MESRNNKNLSNITKKIYGKKHIKNEINTYPAQCLEGKLPLKPGTFVTRALSGADKANPIRNAK